MTAGSNPDPRLQVSLLSIVLWCRYVRYEHQVVWRSAVELHNFLSFHQVAFATICIGHLLSSELVASSRVGVEDSK